METRLPQGKLALLLDIGGLGHLAGGAWVQPQIVAALNADKCPEQRRRKRPFTVRGIGLGGYNAPAIAQCQLHG